MKLPTKRDYSSRSMAPAMRNPVLEEGRDDYKSYQQDFKPMPTNYDDIGNAQARAALYRGQMMAEVTDLGLSAVSAVGKVKEVQSKSRMAAKEVELRSWLAGYVSDAERRGLSTMTEGGQYGYEVERKNYEDSLRKYEAELNKKYRIDDPVTAEEWRLRRMGILSTSNELVDGLIDSAKDIQAKVDAGKALDGVFDAEGVEEWDKEVGQWVFDPKERYELKTLKIQQLGKQEALSFMNSGEGNWRNDVVEAKLQELLGREELTPETKSGIRSTLTAFMEENRRNALREFEKVTADDLAIVIDPETGEVTPANFEQVLMEMYEIQVSAGNIDPYIAKSRIEARIGDIYSQEFAKELVQARKNEDMAEVARIAGDMEMVSDRIVSADFSNLATEVTKMVRTQNWEDLDEYLTGQATTVTTADSSGNLSHEYNGSIAATRIQEISDIIFKGTYEEALEKGINRNLDGWESKAQNLLDFLRTMAKTQSAIEIEQYAKMEKITKHEAWRRAMVADPSIARGSPGNRDNPISISDHQGIFEDWAANELASFNGLIRGNETNEFTAQYGKPIQMDAGNELLMAQQYLRMSGIVPPEYVRRLTTMAVHGSAEESLGGQQGVMDALNALRILYDTDSSILAQAGFKDDGVNLAFELADYVRMSGGDPKAIQEFLQNRKRIHDDPVASKKALESAELALKPGGQWESLYAGMVQGSNGSLPEQMPPRMEADMLALLKSGKATSATTTAFALREVYAIANEKWGVEMQASYDASTGEVDDATPTWVYMSIQEHHNSGTGMDQGSTKEGRTWVQSLLDLEGNRTVRDHLLDATIQDFLTAEGYAGDNYLAMYTEDPSKVTESNPRGGGWILVDSRSMLPYLIKEGDSMSTRALGVSENDPHNDRFAIWIGPDTLSARAAGMETAISNRVQQKQAAEAYNVWATQVGAGEYWSRPQMSAVTAFWGDAKKWWSGLQALSERVDPSAIPISAAEQKDIDRWNSKLSASPKDSLEYLQAEKMGTLLNSEIYRTAVVTGNDQIMKDLQDQTLAIVQGWYETKDLQTKTDADIQAMSTLLGAVK